MIFIRKLANKLVELKGHNEEVSSFLESIPEWAEFEEGSLARSNAIENRPLATDPRRRGNQHEDKDDDYFDLVYKLKDANRSGFQNKKQKEQQQNENDDDEVEVEVEETNENEDGLTLGGECQENGEGLGDTITNKKSRNSGGATSNRKAGYQQFEQEEQDEEDDDQFERLM